MDEPTRRMPTLKRRDRDDGETFLVLVVESIILQQGAVIAVVHPSGIDPEVERLIEDLGEVMPT